MPRVVVLGSLNVDLVVAAARLPAPGETVLGGRFAVLWMRHTGRWWPLHDGLTFEEALGKVAAGDVLRPPI